LVMAFIPSGFCRARKAVRDAPEQIKSTVACFLLMLSRSFSVSPNP
jgi:hypothetical protein